MKFPLIKPQLKSFSSDFLIFRFLKPTFVTLGSWRNQVSNYYSFVAIQNARHEINKNYDYILFRENQEEQDHQVFLVRAAQGYVYACLLLLIWHSRCLASFDTNWSSRTDSRPLGVHCLFSVCSKLMQNCTNMHGSSNLAMKINVDAWNTCLQRVSHITW